MYMLMMMDECMLALKYMQAGKLNFNLRNLRGVVVKLLAF